MLYINLIFWTVKELPGESSPMMLLGDQGSWFDCPGLLKVNTTLAILIIGFDWRGSY